MWNFEKSKCKIFEGPHEKVWRVAHPWFRTSSPPRKRLDFFSQLGVFFRDRWNQFRLLSALYDRFQRAANQRQIRTNDLAERFRQTAASLKRGNFMLLSSNLASFLNYRSQDKVVYEGLCNVVYESERDAVRAFTPWFSRFSSRSSSGQTFFESEVYPRSFLSSKFTSVSPSLVFLVRQISIVFYFWRLCERETEVKVPDRL